MKEQIDNNQTNDNVKINVIPPTPINKEKVSVQK